MARAPKNLIYPPIKVLIFTRNILAKMFLIVRNAFKTTFFQTEENLEKYKYTIYIQFSKHF